MTVLKVAPGRRYEARLRGKSWQLDLHVGRGTTYIGRYPTLERATMEAQDHDATRNTSSIQRMRGEA
jgi:hypothetical protein